MDFAKFLITFGFSAPPCTPLIIIIHVGNYYQAKLGLPVMSALDFFMNRDIKFLNHG